MNHPKPEEWVPYLYGESETSDSRRLKEHLRICPDCRGELQQWKHSLHRLDAWKLAPRVKARQGLNPFLKWATATALILAVGFGVGRTMASTANLSRVRAAIEPEIRKQLRQEFALMLRQELERSTAATLAAAQAHASNMVAESNLVLNAQRLDDNQAIFATMDKYFLTLKKDVDTVAVNTQQELVQLEDSSQASDMPDSALITK